MESAPQACEAPEDRDIVVLRHAVAVSECPACRMSARTRERLPLSAKELHVAAMEDAKMVVVDPVLRHEFPICTNRVLVGTRYDLKPVRGLIGDQIDVLRSASEEIGQRRRL